MILAKTVKGYGMGPSGEAQNVTHQQKKMDEGVQLRMFRTASTSRCRSDEDVPKATFGQASR